MILKTPIRYLTATSLAPLLACLALPSATATNLLVSNATEQSTSFANGTLGAFEVCTTQPVNWPVATTLNGQTCVKFTWNQWRANDNRDTKGSEVCSPLAIQKEGWYGFYIYLPEPGFTTTYESAICQYFANNSACNSWAAHLVMRGRDLLATHRSSCGAHTEGVIRPNFPRNAWVSIITHFVVSHQNAGQFQVWVDGVQVYNAQNINLGYDTWDSNDALLAPDCVGYKLGQYNHANGDVNEVRTSYYTNVSQISGNPAGAYNYIRNPIVLPAAPIGPINRATGGTATCSGQTSAGETAAKAFDSLHNTKWFQGSSGTSGSLTYQFTPGTAWAINRYDVTSGGDVPGRDPRDWEFQGSNDGSTWITLDTRTAQTFSDRNRRNQYNIPNATSYAYFRLNVLANNGDPSGIQLSEMALYAEGGALSSPWATADVGAVNLAGSAYQKSGNFTVTGSGADISGTADEFRYVHQPASGDCTIVARVTTQQNTHAWAKAGLMIRESLNANSRHAMVNLSPSGAEFIRRTNTGGTSASTSNAGIVAPYWFKLVRAGNTFTASRSPDNSVWTTIGSANITMGTNVNIGLAVTSHYDGVPSTATFSNVATTP